MSNKAAIYHFTDGSTKRPIVHQKQIEILKDFATTLGFTEKYVFCDRSIKRGERTEFDRLIECCDQYAALIVKDFYHLSKNTQQCMRLMQKFSDKGVSIYTLENGSFQFEEGPTEQYLRVATYCSRYGEPNNQKHIIEVKNEILKLYAEKKTNWSVVGQFFDETKHQNDGEQIHLQELIQNKERFDLLLVNNLNDVHWRTANFCKIRDQLQMDIYSLQDGFLKYRTEK